LGPSTPITRYDHSLGAMLLVRRYGASLECQAAALLHDIAHTVLSHVLDSVFGRVVHEGVEKEEYLSTTTLPNIIRSYGLDPERVLEESNYTLVELDAPSLCADRIDYGLRDSVAYGFLTKEMMNTILDDLVVSDDKFIVRNISSARILCEAYQKSDDNAWSNPIHAVVYYRTASLIKHALEKNVIDKSTFWTMSDESFWEIFTSSSDPITQKSLKRIRHDLEVEIISKDEYESFLSLHPANKLEGSGWEEEVISLKSKIRTLDPDIACFGEDGEIAEVKKLSELDESYREFRLNYLERKEGTKFYKIRTPV